MKSSTIDPNKIHEYSLEILLQTGFQIEDEAIHDRLLERGVACNRKTGVIRFSPEQIDKALATVPRQVVLGARDARHKIVLAPNGQARFMPSGTGVAVIRIMDIRSLTVSRTTCGQMWRWRRGSIRNTRRYLSRCMT